VSADPLSGARVVVTGAARGLGRAVTLDLLDRGARVVAVDIDGDGLAGLPGSGDLLTVVADVADEAAVDIAFGHATNWAAGLDGVVCNAAIVDVTRAEAGDISVAEFDRVMAVNAGGTWLTCRRAIGAMTGGSIVTLTSQAVFTGSRHMSHYVASKAAVLGMTRALARELGPLGIRVNAVAPGYTDTPGGRAIGDPDTYDTSATPLGRVGQTGDVAGPVAFLLGPGSGFMTGQVLVVDGGRTTH
jgi:NAD(P)-dependent dehydrogenase (short-subunit alcohol dehydrogenase family)